MTIRRPIMSGMSHVELDHQGRLTSFETIPAQKLEAPTARRAGRLDAALHAGRSGHRTAEERRAALDLARRVGYTGGLDRHVAGKRAAVAGRSRRARRTSGGVHGGGALAEAVADDGGIGRVATT